MAVQFYDLVYGSTRQAFAEPDKALVMRESVRALLNFAHGGNIPRGVARPYVEVRSLYGASAVTVISDFDLSVADWFDNVTRSDMQDGFEFAQYQAVPDAQAEISANAPEPPLVLTAGQAAAVNARTGDFVFNAAQQQQVARERAEVKVQTLTRGMSDLERSGLTAAGVPASLIVTPS